MNQCEEIRARLGLYLDGELEGNERRTVEAHLDACDGCRTVLDRERRFLEMVRRSRPLPLASAELRSRVLQALKDLAASPVAKLRPRRGVSRIFWSLDSNNALILNWRAVAAAAAVILLLPLLVWRLSLNHETLATHTPSEFALMAAETHLRHVGGQLPLEITSETPREISAWFANKVKFSVMLPNYQESSGQNKLYRLEGGRLVGYKNDYAAYVAYEMKTRPISLVVTSDTVAQATGGEEIKAKGLTFHFDAINGLKVITWSDRGLTYALVSDLEERGQESCVVCHQGTKDQDFIAPLKPR
jgi:anti-sigma factor (TIGR02949 family)